MLIGILMGYQIFFSGLRFFLGMAIYSNINILDLVASATGVDESHTVLCPVCYLMIDVYNVMEKGLIHDEGRRILSNVISSMGRNCFSLCGSI